MHYIPSEKVNVCDLMFYSSLFTQARPRKAIEPLRSEETDRTMAEVKKSRPGQVVAGGGGGLESEQRAGNSHLLCRRQISTLGVHRKLLEVG